MNYALVPVEPGGGPPIALVRPVLLIGRHPECDVRINMAKISRRHCCLALAYDRILIRDLGSHNGLRVNGRVVEECRLHAEDEVAIGPLIYRVVAEPTTENGTGATRSRPAPAAVATTPRAPGQGPRAGVPGGSGMRDAEDVGLVPLEPFERP
jgi:pSer/pThr/pTyr-binding forkhead associated (FHA) protein